MRTWFFFFMFCYEISALATNVIDKEFFLFVGNPGVGKSTIINSLLEERVTHSGISAGVGLTQKLQHFERDQITYLDTPGLADSKIRSEAGEEIEKALKLNGQYRLFLVITLSSGRIRPEDINTINRVMDAIHAGGKCFNLIINKLTKKELHFYSSQQERAFLLNAFNENDLHGERVHLIERHSAMENDETDFIPISEELRQFIYTTSKGFHLCDSQVNPIDARTLEELKREQEQKIAIEREKLEEQQRQEEILRQQAIYYENERRRIEEETIRLNEEEARLSRAQQPKNDSSDDSSSDGECRLL